MHCSKCAQLLEVGADKAIAEPREEATQEVWVSTLTGDWVCQVDGNEHEPGSLGGWARRVQQTMYAVQDLVSLGTLSAEQGLNVILVDAGLVERTKTSLDLGKALRSGDVDALLKILEEVDPA